MVICPADIEYLTECDIIKVHKIVYEFLRRMKNVKENIKKKQRYNFDCFSSNNDCPLCRMIKCSNIKGWVYLKKLKIIKNERNLKNLLQKNKICVMISTERIYCEFLFNYSKI